jgi:hypothetical protein
MDIKSIILKNEPRCKQLTVKQLLSLTGLKPEALARLVLNETEKGILYVQNHAYPRIGTEGVDMLKHPINNNKTYYCAVGVRR